MPRSEKSPAGRIMSFFSAEDLAVANLVFGMCRDVMRERNQKSAKAKAKALESTASTPLAVAADTRKKKRPSRKRTRTAAAPAALPAEQAESAYETVPAEGEPVPAE